MAERLEHLIAPFDRAQIDCAAYTLTVGSGVYVSPNDRVVNPTATTVRRLTKAEPFTVPPGQFAFLVTKESVKVPNDALTFISIRAKVKFRGLVNVSGFHVDPGYCGQLTFAVYNAGPAPVHLREGQNVFLIWYASLDRKSAGMAGAVVEKGVDLSLVAGVSGELQSFAGLDEKIKNLGERVHEAEKQQRGIQAALILARLRLRPMRHVGLGVC